jgi:hypothetical protein
MAFREYERLVGESGDRLEEVQSLAPTRELVERLNTLIQPGTTGGSQGVLRAAPASW